MPTTIPNPNGNDFDCGDPEFWEYLGLDEDIALSIAECLPEYWRDVAGWYDPASADTIAEKLAKKRLNYHLVWLAHQHYPGTRFRRRKPYSFGEQADPMMEHLVKHYPEKYQDGEWVDTDSPFKALYEQFAHDRAAVPVDEFRDVASELAEQLAKNNTHSRRRPPEGPKRRELLKDGYQYVDGARLGRQDVLQLLDDQEDLSRIRWGPLTYCAEHAFDSNFYVIGAPRSGKTTLLRLLLQSIFNRPDCRLVVYDHKTDLIPFLTPSPDISTAESFHILNPYDARSVGWDIAADATENSADTLATMLIPSGKDDEKKYFIRITRNVLTEVVRILIRKARETNKTWTFFHLMLAIRPSNLRSVLATTIEGRECYKDNVQGEMQTQQNVRSELNDCSQRFVRIAAAWYRNAKDTLSLAEWARSPTKTKGIILGNNDRYSETIQSLNQVLLHFLYVELRDQTIPKHYRTFMILDEFERLAPIPDLVDTVHTAPGQKLNLVFGVHDFDTLKLRYGEAMFGILGTCGFKAFFRVDNPNVAEWLSKGIHDQTVKIPQISTSLSESEGQLRDKDTSLGKQNDDKAQSRGTTTTTTKSQHYTVRRAVSPVDIMKLPLPSSGDAICGYFQGPPFPLYYIGDLDTSTVFYEREVTGNECTVWTKGPDESFRPRDEAEFCLPDDLFEPLRELGFVRDDQPHTAPLLPPTSSISHVDRPHEATPPPENIQVPDDEVDISDMPRRVRRNKTTGKLEM